MSTWDVCVVGGGPAGAAFARRLAQLGHRVVLLERDAFPRAHVGESLPPTILPLLESLGVREAIEAAGFLRPDGVHVRWGHGDTWRPFEPAPGFQVDRGIFDDVLLHAARAAGAHVLQPARAFVPRVAGTSWIVPFVENGTARDLQARLIVDATGRQSSRVRPSPGPRTVALYGYWLGVDCRDAATRIEAGEDGWLWGAPLPDGTMVAAVFVDPERCRAAGRAGLDVLYRARLRESHLLRHCLAGRLAGGVRACDATPHAAAEPASALRIAVGDAAFALDPLSSQGVQAAIASALQAAVVVHTMLERPERTGAALEFHAGRQREAVLRHERTLADYFAASGRDGEFWRRRRVMRTRPERSRNAGSMSAHITLAPDARIEMAPVVEGDLIATRPALAHPGLDRPVAFIDGAPIHALVSALERAGSRVKTVEAWSQRIDPRRALAAFTWLWDAGVIVGLDESDTRRANATPGVL